LCYAALERFRPALRNFHCALLAATIAQPRILLNLHPIRRHKINTHQPRSLRMLLHKLRKQKW
jgi:hypothetical protein